MSLASFNIDWEKWISDNLNSLSRTPKRIALLKALAKRIIDIHQEFIGVHNENREKLSWNGQRILLQRYLQLKFGSDLITIVNSSPSSSVQIEYPVDNLANPITYEAPLFTNPVYSEAGEGMIGANFTVNVPSTVSFDQNQMRAIIDRYLINYKSYIIQIV